MLDDYGFKQIPDLPPGNVVIHNFLLEQKITGREEITFRQICASLGNLKQFRGVYYLYRKVKKVLREMELKGQITIRHCSVMLNETYQEPAVLDDYGFNHIPNITPGNVAIQNFLLKHKLNGRETITMSQILSNLRNRKQFDGVRSKYLKVKRVLEEMQEKGQIKIDRQTVILNQE